MKIIFLDFDGVLNSEAFFRASGNRYLPETLDVAAVARVSALVARTGAHVVISSTWRLGYSLEQLRGILQRHGFSGEVVGVTPVIQHLDEDGIRLLPPVSRGQEIQRWIDDQPAPPEAFVILDDDTAMAHLGSRQVLTLFDIGLSDDDVEAAVALLGGPFPAG